jgi:octaprenyl-diphosphate synthase
LGGVFNFISNDFDALEHHLITSVPEELPEARRVLRHVFSSGGKRVRPALFYLSARLTGYEGPHRHDLATVWEYIHTASLLHDDVVDNSTLRRNKPTANSIWGSETAVLVGDLVYASAAAILARVDLAPLGRLSASVSIAMTAGELLQLSHLFDANIPEDIYYRIIHGKTAALLSASCQSAALIKGSPSAERDALETFGREIGYAFQLVDDALDFVAEQEKLGKKTGADLLRGTVTLPVILLRQRASQAEWEMVRTIIAKEEASSEDIARVTALIHKHQTIDGTLARACQHTQAAITALSVFPDSPARAHLIDLAHALTSRQN